MKMRIRSLAVKSTPLLFSLFITLTVIVILNMVIVIISEAYLDAFTEMKNKPKLSISGLVREISSYLIGKVEGVPVVGPRLRCPSTTCSLESAPENKIAACRLLASAGPCPCSP